MRVLYSTRVVSRSPTVWLGLSGLYVRFGVPLIRRRLVRGQTAWWSGKGLLVPAHLAALAILSAYALPNESVTTSRLTLYPLTVLPLSASATVGCADPIRGALIRQPSCRTGV